ncbi:MAG TPA: SagB/ThcOx family dehydrogenase [Solirubrobacteraceae bacterium]|jgi:SagB-type dehydrogenase family enzyme|nr:SagB/ThcOx family dehydrogenase [Solirubrobacteraceae bacterium]
MATDKPARTELPLEYFLENEYHPLIEIFHWGANLAGSVYTDTTAVVPPEAAYSSAAISRTHLLSQEFLLNYKRSSLDLGLPIGVSGYFGFPARGSLALRHLSDEEAQDNPDEIVRLPPYQHVNASLGVTIRARRSVREFTGKTMRLQDLGTLLFYGNGVTGDMGMISDDDQWPTYSLGDPDLANTRAASSGGGLNPISLYLVVRNVEALDDGVYVYLPFAHALKRICTFTEEQRQEHLALGASWGPNIEPATVNVALYYVYSVYENSRKYGDLGLMFAVVEAGEIAAHIHLVCTATNIGSSDLGGWEKVQTERFLGVDGLSKQLVHATVIGML